jgi:hypothetical protein
MEPVLTAEYIRTIFDYDPNTGKFSWKNRRRADFSTPQAYGAWKKRCYGKEPGAVAGLYGYRIMNLKGRFHQAHRLAWLHFHGEWPSGHIDHINGDASDNRICNLRDVSNADNRRNTGLPTTNTSGAIGVSLTASGKWEARLQKDGRTVHLGRFALKDDAIRARRAADAAFGFHPNHGQRPSIPLGAA